MTEGNAVVAMPNMFEGTPLIRAQDARSFMELLTLSSTTWINKFKNRLPVLSKFFVITFAAMASGLIFWFVPRKMALRYIADFHFSGAGALLFSWAMQFSCMLTNILFNAASFLILWEWCVSGQSNRQCSFSKGIKWFATVIIAFFSIFPIWYLSWRDPEAGIGVKILDTISAAFGVVVNFEGCIQLITHMTCLPSLLLDSFRSVSARLMLCCKSVNVEIGYVELSSLSASNSSSKSKWCQLLWLPFLIIAGLGVFHNLAFTLATFLAFQPISFPLAIFALLLHLVPSLGFTMKGIIGLYDFMIHDNLKLSALFSKKYLMFSAVTFFVLIAAALSGGTADQAMYESGSILFKELSQAWLKVMSAACNVGTAWCFNFPQIVSLLWMLLHSLGLNSNVQEANIQISDPVDNNSAEPSSSVEHGFSIN